MGGLHRKFGNLAEHLVAPGISKRFNEMGYHFAGVSPGGYRVEDGQGRTLTQIDILLENGETIIAVEVKANPAKKDINHHIKRLEILRASRQSLNDQRKILGAIAGAIYEDDVKEAVREAGFFVIEQSGDTMKIDMPEGFAPRVF
jgi:predicted AAA+ superfamily ATPase